MDPSEPNQVLNGTKEVLGMTALESRGILNDPNWYWFGTAGLICFIILFNITCTLALSYLDRKKLPKEVAYNAFFSNILKFFCSKFL